MAGEKVETAVLIDAIIGLSKRLYELGHVDAARNQYWITQGVLVSIGHTWESAEYRAMSARCCDLYKVVYQEVQNV